MEPLRLRILREVLKVVDPAGMKVRTDVLMDRIMAQVANG